MSKTKREPPITVTSAITRHRVDLDSKIDVFTVQLANESGIYLRGETVGSLEHLQWFLWGAQACGRAIGVTVTMPKIPTRSVPHKKARKPSQGPPCGQCGSIMARSGGIYKCPNCGETSSGS